MGPREREQGRLRALVSAKAALQGQIRTTRRQSVMVVVVLVILGLFATSGIANAAPTLTFFPSQEFGARLGEGTLIEPQLTIAGTEYEGTPYPLTKLTLRLPKGAVISNSGFATCSKAVLEPSGPGPAACPEGSLAGMTGEFRVYVSFGGERIWERGTVEVFFSPEGGMFLFLTGHSPLSLEILAVGKYLAPTGSVGPGVQFDVPLIETIPGAPDASIVELLLPLGALRLSGGKTLSSITSPTECTTSLAWSAEAEFTNGKGTTTSASKEATSACPTLGGTRVGTSITASAPKSAIVGEEVTYSATITPQSAGPALTGTVTFLENGRLINGGDCSDVAVTPEGGTAKATCKTHIFGYYSLTRTANITAIYDDDGGYAPSISAPAEVLLSEAESEEEAVAKKHAEEEAARTKHAEEAAAAKHAEEAAAKKHAEEEATARKKAEEEALAKKRGEEAAKRAEEETLAAVAADLAGHIGPGKGRLRALREHGRLTISVTSPTAGTLTVTWYFLPPGAHLSGSHNPIAVASGKVSFASAGIGKLIVRLTSKGKALLKGRNSLKLTAKGVFVMANGKSVAKTQVSTLH